MSKPGYTVPELLRHAETTQAVTGCDRCASRIRVEDVNEGITHLTIIHEDTCPVVRVRNRKARRLDRGRRSRRNL